MTPPLTIAILAKVPLPGRVKTRLCPPCSPSEAAALAGAALEDTMAAALAVAADRHVLVLDGHPAGWTDRGFEVLAQRGDGLDQRLAAAFADLVGPTLLVGMDTPQITAGDLAHGLSLLADPTTGAVLGMAEDGGYWAIGLPEADDAAFLGVPMSQADTGAAQLARLRSQGRVVCRLPERRDVDRWVDAMAVAEAAPHTRFARALAAVRTDLSARGAA